MALNMRTSQAGLDVIKTFEGFRPRSERLPNGRWIIGYGHVRQAKEGIRVSESEAEAILREYDLPPVERFVMRCVLAPTTQNEFDALVSLAFNIGPKSFASSDVVASFNGGNRLEAAQAFDAWRRAKIGGRVQIVDALVRRRAVEKALFLKSPGQVPTASSRLYRAMHDSETLPLPPPPREILVERSAVALEGLDPIETLEEVQKGDLPVVLTATEQAAESVREQMIRILGEDGDKVTTDATATDGATPEEITAAISELAGDAGTEPIQKSVWPDHSDLPLADDHDQPTGPLEPVEDLLPPLQETDIIDDLEEVTVTPESIERAVQANGNAEHEKWRGGVLAALPFGLLALIGAALCGYGMASQFGLIKSGHTVVNTMAIYMPPFLMLLGVLLFLVMAYQFVRTLTADE
ncbi:MAG: lysozyme [Pseudomonadota bacterium]